MARGVDRVIRWLAGAAGVVLVVAGLRLELAEGLLRAVLASQGHTDAALRVTALGPYRTRIEGIRIGRTYRIRSLVLRYSPMAPARGLLEDLQTLLKHSTIG